MFTDLAGFQTTIGVSIVVKNDGTTLVHACQVSKKNGQLDFDKKIVGLTSINELKKDLSTKTPLAINISGKGVLYKQVEKIETVTQSNFGSILPNANFGDFYIQNTAMENWSFIAIVRKTDADQWIGQLQNEGFGSLMLSLGPFATTHILPQLNIYEGDIIFDGHTLSRDENNNWTKYRYDPAALAPFPLKAETEPLAEQLVPAYASAFQLMMADKLDLVFAPHEALNQAYQNARTDNKVKSYGMVVLFSLFGLLLVNFIVFSYYNSNNVKLAYQVSRSAQNSTEIKGLADSVKSKEQKLQNLGWDGGINKARLIDQLASELPPEVSWQQIAIDPVDMNVSRNQKTLVFKDRHIGISGLSPKIIPVNEWMARMRSKHWVKDIQLENYSFNNELNTGQFKVDIAY